MVPQHICDEIQKLRTKENSLKHEWMKTQEAPLNTWWCWKRATTDFLKATSSCIATLDYRTSNHGFMTIKRYVRKSSSMTLNEALCGRQPDLFIYLYKLWQVYIVLFIWKLQVTLYHCSNNALINVITTCCMLWYTHTHTHTHTHIEWALCYLKFGKLVDHFFVCLLVFRVFLFVSFREKYEAW
jgi:hypothetical protein